MRGSLILLVFVSACGSVDNGSSANACSSPSMVCDGTCTNVMADNSNCGTCGNACEAGQRCDGNGMCAVTCAAGTELCDGSCTDTMSDDDNCGTCGNACDAGQRCDGTGHCAATCETNYVSCGGHCIDPMTSDTNCGASGDCLDANAGTSCLTTGGVCSAGACKTALVRYDSYWAGSTMPQQCDDYKAWKTELRPTMKSIHVYGSNNLAGYTCTDPTAVATLVNAVKTETSAIVTCGANSFQYCATQYGGTVWVNGPSLCSGSNCSAAGQAMLRPCIPSTYIGVYGVGIDASACNGAAQYGAVEFGY